MTIHTIFTISIFWVTNQLSLQYNTNGFPN